MKRHLLLVIGFKGTAYHGFQVQDNARTVCSVLQDAMEVTLGSRGEVKGCSRTDAGVHALVYGISFFTESEIPEDRLPLALNQSLPADIRVFRAREVPQDFHARYSCTGKVYQYRIRNSPVDSPFESETAWRVWPLLDPVRMRDACAFLIGRHDFSGFMASGSVIQEEGRSTVRVVRSAGISTDGSDIRFTIDADGYLYHMVRIMAGTLVECGAGKRPVSDICEIMRTGDRRLSGLTAPAKGLFLVNVHYPGFDLDTML